MVAEFDARSVLDVGCGTGAFACLLADRGIQTVGVDPAAASLEVARTKPGAQRVRWLQGDATTLPELQVDLATMTGNTAQVFLTDDDWSATLRGIHAALRPGGHLVFEVRDPAGLEGGAGTVRRPRSRSTPPTWGGSSRGATTHRSADGRLRPVRCSGRRQEVWCTDRLDRTSVLLTRVELRGLEPLTPTLPGAGSTPELGFSPTVHACRGPRSSAAVRQLGYSVGYSSARVLGERPKSTDEGRCWAQPGAAAATTLEAIPPAVRRAALVRLMKLLIRVPLSPREGRSSATKIVATAKISSPSSTGTLLPSSTQQRPAAATLSHSVTVGNRLSFDALGASGAPAPSELMRRRA